MENIEVLVLLDVSGLEDEEKLNKFLKRKSFKIVEGEKNVYTSTSTTTLVTTKTFILQIFKEGLEKVGFTNANLIFLLNETPYPAHYYDHDTNHFELSKEESK
ncbi:MAG: hypothetical protein CL623_13145 [Arcobacter sp.]|nr:hypothetical protein [Arcobacter sp.]|tara:strand:- start:812 stop:1120 length:309 start_codon:yes stop_codon:yes gene_type:complete